LAQRVLVQAAHPAADSTTMGPVSSAVAPLADAVADPAARLLDGVLEIVAVDGGLAELAPVLAELACSIAGVDGASVAVVEADALSYIAATGALRGIEGSRNPRQGSLGGIAIATGSLQVSLDTVSDTRVNHYLTERFGIRSMAIMPIRVANYTQACVMLTSSRPNVVSDATVELVEPLLRAATLKLTQAGAAESAAGQLARLQDATSASRDVLLAEDPGQYLVDTIARVAAAPHVYLLMPRDTQTLTVTKSFGHSLFGEESAADESSLCGTAYATGRPKIVADWTAHPAARSQIVAAIAAGSDAVARSAVYIPLMTADGPVGVVAALMREPITASNADLLGLLQLLAAEAGVALTRDELRRTLADQARTDVLTGLSNRRVWTERMAYELARSRRAGRPLAIGLLDLDLFKQYNDTHGHLAGDDLLRQAAAAWTAALRPTDLIARLGGEEFGVLLPDTPLDAAEMVLERLGRVVPCGQTVSAGLTVHLPYEESFSVMNRADQALYAAKAAGRNRVISR
jgi:diguanylate cyclase (GGDEF)-like protein